MHDNDDGESFARHPITISEMRARKSGDAIDWTPRDVLLWLLRNLDSGEIEPPRQLIVVMEHANGGVGYAAATKDTLSRLGIMDIAKHAMLESPPA
jgi:hypothetical protein